MKTLIEIKQEIERLINDNEINKDRLEHFKGNTEKENMYNTMINNNYQKIITLEWVLDFKL